jgi:SPP1 family predicted phage head-tail adaptor
MIFGRRQRSLLVKRGQLRCRVTLDRLVQRPDGEGGFEDTFVPLDPPQAWALIEPATQRDLERVAANATIEAVATHIVTIDYHPQVTIQTRITYGDRVLQVRSRANPDESNVELILVCAEVLPGGTNDTNTRRSAGFRGMAAASAAAAGR